MGPTATDETWRPFTEPHGYFRIEIPDSWRGEQSGFSFTHRYKDHSWSARSFITTLTPSVQDRATRQIVVTIRIEQYAETPPPMKGVQEPTDIQYLRTYRIVHDSEWLTCTVGHLRVHIQYHIQWVLDAPVYHPMVWEPPAPVSPDEQQKRLALVQRIIDSFDLLMPS